MFKRKSPSALQEQLAAITKKGGSFESDGNEWKLKQDKAGNGTAVIRFLPGKDDDSLPFVKLVTHGFKHNSKWYIENCSSTHGDYDNCPVCAYLSANDTYNSNNELYKNLKRKTSYWSNILVIKDPAAPENEGKVFKYRINGKIMPKIVAMSKGDEAVGEEPIDVTCVFGGANFLIKVKKDGQFLNYDDCKFQSVSEIKGIDSPEVQKMISEGMFDIMALAKPDQFKALDVLSKGFNSVMGTAASGTAASAAASAAASLDSQLDDFDKAMDEFDDVGKTDDTPPFDMDSGDSGLDDDLDDLLNDL